MGRNKGAQKTGGRTKGTPNKTTAELKEQIAWFQGVGMGMIEKYMNDPKIKREEKINLFLSVGPKLAKFVIPVQSETKINFDQETMNALKEAQEKVNDMFKFNNADKENK